jgi:threonine dehydrogenase-like Zn-dependent dehydrogenase
VAQAIRSLSKAGRLVLAGLLGGTAGTDIPLAEVTTKELEIAGAWLNPGTFADALEMVGQMGDILSGLDTAVFSLGDVAEAFELAARPDAPKVLVRP